ncbi:uncharacterized protein LOC109820967 [Asparagus officinalis]|uniref:uncharacterized protein LOC109820967 n=1 Tax=Asparagus officinalis TaxID=4686 RepID=UPI00098E6C1B|nr:uncharacterized protein LOC109820967 [Asparagus officinalis]
MFSLKISQLGVLTTTMFSLKISQKSLMSHQVYLKRNLDYVLTEDKPEEPDESSSLSEKKSRTKWVKANKLAMLIIRALVDQTICGGIPTCKTAKELLETIKKQFKGSVRAKKYSYLVKLNNLKYDESGDVRQHILKVSQLIIRLRELRLQLEDDLMVYFVVASLPSKFDIFKVKYSSQDRK